MRVQFESDATTTQPARVAALVPAYQAAQHLGPVLEGIRAELPREAIFVVDDGSTDGTADVARAAGVQLVQHPRNRGKGAALMTGFEAAAAAGFTHVITLDADGQHPPASIPAFIAMLPEADIVIGSRLHDAATMPRDRKFSNRATAAILGALAAQTILDGQSGYRLYHLGMVRAIRFEARGFMFESEILIKASRAGASIGHVSIPCVYGDQGSHINKTKNTLQFLALVGRSFFW
jgi:glycosyltransferase involved in cell wall biosynthesis